MTHVRQQIADQAKTALTGLPTTGSRVKVNPPYLGKDDEMPGLVIRTLRDERDRNVDSVDCNDQTFLQEMRVIGRVKGPGEDPGIILNQILEEVSPAMVATFPGVLLSRIEMDFSGDLDDATGEITMFWLIDYRIDLSNPSTPL